LGRILFEQGDFQSALQNFERALQINSNVDLNSQFVYKGETEDIFKAMAEVYFRQRKFKEAILELSRLDDLPIGSFQFEKYMWALKHYKLGKIHEEMNNIETAKKEYAKFLDLWKDADPGIAEVDDARKRLARLKGENL
jgi:tetratricopeptide (TPR) repeat protein